MWREGSSLPKMTQPLASGVRVWTLPVCSTPAPAALVYGQSAVQPTALAETWVSVVFPLTRLLIQLVLDTWKAGRVCCQNQAEGWMTSSAVWALPPSRPQTATNMWPGTPWRCPLLEWGPGTSSVDPSPAKWSPSPQGPRWSCSAALGVP